jgi:starvation-inducible outer membrane lipoprotein
MKYDKSLFLTGSIILTLVCVILAAGCSSSATPSKNGAVTATSALAQVTVVQTSEQTSAVTVAATTAIPTKTVILSNGMTISYPITWEMEESSDTSLRDYGRVTTNIANFFSPTTYNGKYVTFSIDVDPETISDNDRYFNLATVAVQNTFGTIEITHHTQMGYTEPCTMCKTYNLEFEADLETRTDSGIDKRTLQRWYHFIDADGTFYIITINNPGLAYDQAYEMLKSIKVTTASTGKHR